MANKPSGVIYIGVTNDIEERVKEHKLKVHPKSFSANYNCDKLMCFEEFKSGTAAEKCERQFKKWKRDWKIELIDDMNPSWSDLSLNWNLNYKKIRK